MDNRLLTAHEGRMLTNGETYATKVRLGDWDSPDNWREIPREEYEAATAVEQEVTDYDGS